tara:strand:- start:917 stop:1444 length:528 start_codon:yes stop_codon:yes gene_type:complete
MSEDTTTETTTAPPPETSENSATVMMVDAPKVMQQSAPQEANTAPAEQAKTSEIGKEQMPVEPTHDISALEAQIQALQDAQKLSADALQKHETAMRETLLSKLGVIDKYRQYAPQVDPFSDDGRADLEKWAQENTELLESRPNAVPEVDMEGFKKRLRSPHLVDLATFNKSMRNS